MRKIREVLRLYFDLNLGQRPMARSPNISQSTVHDYLERFTAARLSWPLPAEMAEAELEAALFPAVPDQDREPTAERPLPDSCRPMGCQQLRDALVESLVRRPSPSLR